MPYEELEGVLQFIHKHFAAPHVNSSVARNESEKVLKQLVKIMRREDKVFEEVFEKYDLRDRSLQVKKPFDFDVKFIFKLPRCQLEGCSDVPGYMEFKTLENSGSIYQKFREGNHLQTNLIFNWMKSLIYRALNNIKKEGTISNFVEYKEDNSEIVFCTEYGSNLVICISPTSGDPICLHITAAFEIGKAFWPGTSYGYKRNSTNKDTFLIIPVSPNQYLRHYWQLDFGFQENDIIKGTERLKPALRLLKLMKTNLIHQVSNYALKTLILAEAEDSRNDWIQKSLSATFMLVLDNYINGLANSHIPYFWNTTANLIENLKEDTRFNHYNQLTSLRQKIVCEYERDPTVVARVILKGNDYNTFLELWKKRSSDDSDWSGSLENPTLRNDLATAAVVTGAVGVCALGAVLWNHFSNRSNS